MGKAMRIVIPAFNACNTIQKCIEAIIDALSFHDSWEIVIVDNGRNPGLEILFKTYPVTVLKRDAYQSAAYARNEGAKWFTDGILVFVDSDVIVERDCLKNLIAPLHNNLCNATIGNYSKNIKDLNFSQRYKQLYINHIYDRDDEDIRNDFWTAICAVDAKVFSRLNGFNSDFRGANGEDQEFGIRLTKHTFRVWSVKNANGQHLNPYGVFKIIRNDFRKGLKAVKNSLENKVPFTDNRHSKLRDILSVCFSIVGVMLLGYAFIVPEVLAGCIAAFSAWYVCRIPLSNIFFRKCGFLFFTGSLVLMFCLDLTRFLCVVIGLVKFKLLRFSFKEVDVVSIPVES